MFAQPFPQQLLQLDPKFNQNSSPIMHHHHKTAQRNRMMSDQMSTKANSPDCSELDEKEIRSNECFHNMNAPSSTFSLGQNDHSTNSSTGALEIDVKPKRKVFHTNEEKQRFIADYSRKLKTEMCKNWETTGSCKFGDKCSFAHGGDELKGKNHLHSNYKTKPCKKYFLKGFCSYGMRCQYLHRELLKRPEYRDFVQKVYSDKKLYLPTMKSNQSEEQFWTERFKNLNIRFYNKSLLKNKEQEPIPVVVKTASPTAKTQTQTQSRLPVFKSLAPANENQSYGTSFSERQQQYQLQSFINETNGYSLQEDVKNIIENNSDELDKIFHQ